MKIETGENSLRETIDKKKLSISMTKLLPVQRETSESSPGRGYTSYEK